MIFLDIETSGLDPYKHEIIEVGYVIVDPDNPDNQRQVEFSLAFNELVAEPQALEVNGYGKRKFPTALTKQVAIAQLNKDLADQRICCNNPAFDMAFLNQLVWRNYADPTWHHHAYDIKSIFAGVKGIPYDHVSTNTIVRQLDLHPKRDDDGYHTALSDAMWNFHVYARLGMFDDQF